ncbi:hypothetical protein JCM4914_74840 [Streptomyces platensis subsp. malvinus]
MSELGADVVENVGWGAPQAEGAGAGHGQRQGLDVVKEPVVVAGHGPRCAGPVVGVGSGEAGVECGERPEVGVPATTAVDFAVLFTVGGSGRRGAPGGGFRPRP